VPRLAVAVGAMATEQSMFEFQTFPNPLVAWSLVVILQIAETV